MLCWASGAGRELKHAIATHLESMLKVLMPSKTEPDVRRIAASSSSTSHAAVARDRGIILCQAVQAVKNKSCIMPLHNLSGPRQEFTEPPIGADFHVVLDGVTFQAHKVRDSKPQVGLGMSESVIFMSTDPGDTSLKGAPKISMQLAGSYACRNSTPMVEHSTVFFPKSVKVSETIFGKHDSPSNCIEGNSGASGLFDPAGQSTIITTHTGANGQSGVFAALEQGTQPHYVLTKTSGPSKISMLLNSIVAPLTASRGPFFHVLTMGTCFDTRAAGAAVASLTGVAGSSV